MHILEQLKILEFEYFNIITKVIDFGANSLITFVSFSEALLLQ